MRMVFAVQFAVFVLVGVVIGAFLYAVGHSVLFGCDRKLGCEGAIMLSLTFGSIAGVLAGASAFLVAAISESPLTRVSEKARKWSAILSGVLLGPLLHAVLTLKVGTLGLLAGWLVACVLVSSASMGVLIAVRTLTMRSSRPPGK